MTAARGIRGLVGVVAATAVVLAGCGGGDGSEGAIADYCKAVEELEARGEEIFSSIDQDDPTAIRAGEGKIADAVEEVDLVGKAPTEIRDDVKTYSAGFRARANGQEGDEDAINAAEERIVAFEEEHCGT